MRVAILATALVGALSSPVKAGDFAAFDVLTVCTTTPSDPTTVAKRFISEGWAQIDLKPDAPEKNVYGLINFAVTSVLARPLAETATQTEWEERWALSQAAMARKLEVAPNGQLSVLRDPVSGATLIVQTVTGSALSIDCFLAVPTSVTTLQTYHPKLAPPRPPATFAPTFDTMSFPSSRVTASSIMISVDPVTLSSKLHFSTDIAAVFLVSIQYPAWAVTP